MEVIMVTVAIGLFYIVGQADGPLPRSAVDCEGHGLH